jgi:hypothetical protein
MGQILPCRLSSLIALFAIVFGFHTSTISYAQPDCTGNIQGDNSVNLSCGGQLNGTAGPIGAGPFEYSWTGPNGFTSNEQNPNITVSGDYVLTVSGKGCQGVDSDDIEVNITALTSMAEAGINRSKCAGETIAFTIPNNGVSTNNAQNGTGPYTYEWSPATGLSNPFILNPSCSVTTTTTYTLTVTDVYGCTDTDQMAVTVTPSAIANLEPGNGITETDFNGVLTFYRCGVNASTNFQFSDPIGGTSGSAYVISWGDGTPNWSGNATPNAVNHIYTPGLYDLTYTITEPNGCVSTVTYQVFYGSNPAVGLGNPGNTNVCSPQTLEFPITGTSNNAPGTQYTITFNDGSPPIVFNHPPPSLIAHTFEIGSCNFTATDGVNDFQNAFSANIVAENPCGISSGTIVPIIVNTSPESNFTIDPLPNACVNSPVTLTSEATAVEIFGNQCNTNPPIVYTITPANGWSVASGAIGNTNGFDVFGDNWDPLSWTSGTNTVSIVFNQPGTYTIEQLVGISCGTASSAQEICIEPQPVPNFSVTPLQGCSPLTSTIDNNSSINGCDVQFEWDVQQLTEGCPPQPGNINFNASSFEPAFVFNGQGTYAVTLTLTNSCGSFEQTVGPITVNGPPIIEQLPLDDICAGQG